MHGRPGRPNKPHTHTAYLAKRTGKRSVALLECGSGRIDPESNRVELVIDRTPLGGWTGYVQLAPRNAAPVIDAATADELDDEDAENEDAEA